MLETRSQAPLTPPSSLGPHRASDYAGLPDEPRHELLYGRLYRVPSPTLAHQVVVGEIFARLRETMAPSGALVVVAPIDVALADHSVVQPDLVLVTAARAGVLGTRIEGAPDLLVEVLSPSTVLRDRGEKLRLCADSGVREYWLVDPETHATEFLVLREGRWLVAMAADGRYDSEEIEGLGLDVEGLWAEVVEATAVDSTAARDSSLLE